MFVTTGCPGTLDPTEFPQVGGAGTGATGTAGTTGGLPPGCAMADQIFIDHSCALAGSCHDAMGSAGGFKMTPAGWEAALVDKMPAGGGALASMCATVGMPYIIKGPRPVGGLFMNKLRNKTPACGAQMPNLPPVLTPTELQCIQDWADKLGAP